MEIDLDYNQVIEGYNSFIDYISDEFNKHLLINTIDRCIEGPEWPKSYYNLRDEFLPKIMGIEASMFLFWFALGGNIKDNSYDDIIFKNEKANTFLNYLLFNYSLDFKRAKQFNVNPLGFDKVDFTHNQNRNMFNMYLLRNDSDQFLMSVDTKDFSLMISDILYYFSLMLNEGAVSFEDISNLRTIVSDLESTTIDLKEYLITLESELEERENE
ncbi:hypothetical protein ACDX78_02080 [Virgibacillus oceani]